MRQSIGSTWILGLMVTFIFLFSTYIILTINYSKSIKVKNEIVNIVEKYEGLNDNSIRIVNQYLTTNGYTAKGVCTGEDKPGIYGAEDLDSTTLETAKAGKKYYYCLHKYKGLKNTYYYQVEVFYKFNLPILSLVTGFSVKGTTNSFKPYDLEAYCYNVSGSCEEVSEPGDTNRTTYTVTFNLGGGSGSIPNQIVAAGGRATRPTDPVKSGFQFAGWTLNGAQYDFSSSVNRNIELVASWTASGSSESNTVTLTFNGSGGYFLDDTRWTTFKETIVKGQKSVNSGLLPKRAGYNLSSNINQRWRYADGRYFTFDTPIYENTVVYAVWGN